MGVIWMAIVGLVVGVIAKVVMPGKDPGGIMATIILGILGAFIGGALLGLIMPGPGFGGAGLIGSILGAVLLLWIYRVMFGRARSD